VLDNIIHCANVGDSRAVLGNNKNNKWKPIALSRDHKPNVRSEAERIFKENGRIDSFRDHTGKALGPLRV
jgi:serine/threonine protein phosphatase PrpC